ncbi:hypothetical protein KO527_05255 [Pseudoalteromonas sp. C2R02]|uniref:hypothetical protein n=1 Tax=Pseudoalteromonas sp. C2R02 TaxID=2841565 RepID=UPI001C097DC2|nr:hypothetical protein [Pseudoalteromonas sp. C2R02]MBU2968755.1 hypothetical protein [Pseudoalteromonas sp. C2R02]
MQTNGIEHYLKVGGLVWSLACTVGQVFRIKNITNKRVVCQEVGMLTPDGIVMFDLNLSHSNHSPENLFEVESYIPVL